VKPSDLDGDRWHEIDRLLEKTLDLPPEERDAFLTEACAEDVSLREQLDALLDAHDRSDAFFDGTARPLAAALAAGAGSVEEGVEIGPFRPIREIGRGGMGIVYLAEDTRLARPVALKVLPPWIGVGREARRRFRAEARAVSALDHPNIATLYEVDETPAGQLYMAFAFYDGETLADRISRGPLPVGEALDIAIAIAAGLSAAHARGIVHRDVKPSNVLLTEGGAVKLVDFGLAKIAGEEVTDAGVRMGTVAYMSPEQARGDVVDRRTDLWSLGIIVYEMLGGRRPFDADSYPALVRFILEEEAEPLHSPGEEVPREVQRVVRKLLRKSPADRYTSADDLLEDLRTLDAGERPTLVAHRTPGVGGESAPLRPAHSMRWRTAAGLVVPALAVAGLAAWIASRDTSAGESIERAAREAYSIGRIHLERRNREGLELARNYFRRATEIDPDFAPAYAMLAETYAQAGNWGMVAPSEGFAEARRLGEYALELDSAVAEAYSSLAAVSLYYDRDWGEAARLARRATALDPGYVLAYSRLAQALTHLGDPDGASAAGARAAALEHLPPFPQMRSAIRAYRGRDYETAIDSAAAAREFDAGIWQASWLICLSLVGQRAYPSAIDECGDGAARFDRNPIVIGALGYAYAAAGRRADALDVLARMDSLSSATYVGATLRAIVFGALGERARALAWLERAIEEHDVLLAQTRYPFFDPLRADPRVDSLLEAAGVDAQARDEGS